MKFKSRNYKKTKKRYPMYILGTILVVSILFISVGFSALSTSLSIDGSTAFAPIGMIRVISISQDTLVSTTEVSKGIMPDSIKTTIDINDINGYATYNVVIKNLGQIDYALERIDEVVYSNNQMEYIFDGFQIGNVIRANQEVTFKV